jgi:hypothetical protein
MPAHAMILSTDPFAGAIAKLPPIKYDRYDHFVPPNSKVFGEVVTDLSSCLQQNDYCRTNEGLELFATYKVRMYSCNAINWMEWLYGIF